MSHIILRLMSDGQIWQASQPWALEVWLWRDSTWQGSSSLAEIWVRTILGSVAVWDSQDSSKDSRDLTAEVGQVWENQMRWILRTWGLSYPLPASGVRLPIRPHQALPSFPCPLYSLPEPLKVNIWTHSYLCMRIWLKMGAYQQRLILYFLSCLMIEFYTSDFKVFLEVTWATSINP